MWRSARRRLFHKRNKQPCPTPLPWQQQLGRCIALGPGCLLFSVLMDHTAILPDVLDGLATGPLLLPLGLVGGTVVLVLLLAVVLPRHQRCWLRPVVLAGLVLAGAGLGWVSSQLGGARVPVCSQLLVVDGQGLCLVGLLLGLTALLVLSPVHFACPAEGVLVLGVLLAGCWLVLAFHWLSVYLGLSLLSMAAALLLGGVGAGQGAVGGLRYLLYGLAMSALMLWGMAYWYGFTGTLALAAPAVAQGWLAVPGPVCVGTWVLCLSGVWFALGAVPCHFWVPGVYQSAPAGVVACLSTVPKLAALGVVWRCLRASLPLLGPVLQAQVQEGLALLALLTLLVGHVGAVLQTEGQRLLAYGTVAQGGLLLAGLVAVGTSPVGLLHYSVVYGVMSLAAWAGLQVLQQVAGAGHWAALQGLGRRFPVLGGSCLVAMLSLVGLPPTAGFTSKFLLLTGLWAHAQRTGSVLGLALCGASVLGTVLSGYYYLKLPYVLFCRPAVPAAQWRQPSGQSVLFLAGLAGLLVAGFFLGGGGLVALLPSEWAGLGL